jgi:hypothetical protein
MRAPTFICLLVASTAGRQRAPLAAFSQLDGQTLRSVGRYGGNGQKVVNSFSVNL